MHQMRVNQVYCHLLKLKLTSGCKTAIVQWTFITFVGEWIVNMNQLEPNTTYVSLTKWIALDLEINKKT